MRPSGSFLRRWTFTLFLLCSPAPRCGSPAALLANRTKRTVTHAQLMHDKGRVLHDLRRHAWLQQLLQGVHTAEERDPPARSGTASCGADAASSVAGSFGGGLQPKPTGSAKIYPMGFPPKDEDKEEEDEDDDEEGGTRLPQETNKVHALKTGSKKRKKGRPGKRRDGDRRKRRLRSLGGVGPRGASPPRERAAGRM